MSMTPAPDEAAREPLWCVNILGPDDIYPAPDVMTAVAWANAFNASVARHKVSFGNGTPDDFVLYYANVIPYPYGPESHAAGLAHAVEMMTPPASGVLPSDAASIPSRVFVFGSNLAGRHGKGAALYARQHHGAIYGQGVGPQGNSYAIPTKNERLRTLPLLEISYHVRNFMRHAAEHPERAFQVTRIGCGLAGYKDEDIAPLFRGAPPNCELPDGWRALASGAEARSGETAGLDPQGEDPTPAGSDAHEGDAHE